MKTNIVIPEIINKPTTYLLIPITFLSDPVWMILGTSPLTIFGFVVTGEGLVGFVGLAIGELEEVETGELLVIVVGATVGRAPLEGSEVGVGVLPIG